MKHSRFRRPIEFAILLAIYCGSSLYCYEAGVRKSEPAVPVVIPPPATSPITEPAPKQVQPAEAPEPRKVAEAQPVSQTKVTAEAAPVPAKPAVKPPVAKPVAKPVAPVVQPNQCQPDECQQFYRRRRRR